jgi:hypothetical protein
LCRLSLALALAVGLGLGALAWRLSQGPLELPILARQIEAAANTPEAPARLSVGHAAIAWQGWREGYLTPVEVRLSGVTIRDAGGQTRAGLPDAALSLSLPWLLTGHIAPRQVELEGLSLRLVRSADGAVRLDLGPEAAAAAEVPVEPPPEGQEGTSFVAEVLAELMRPPGEATPRGALSRLRIHNARIELVEETTGLSGELQGALLDIRRRPGGGLQAEALATLAVRGAAATRVPLQAYADVTGDPAQARLRVTLPALRPAELSGAAPALAPLAALDLPMRAELEASLAEDLQVGPWTLWADAGAGRVVLGEGGAALPLQSLSLALQGQGIGGEMQLTRAALRPAAPATPVGPVPTVSLTGSAAPEAGGGWRAGLELALDEVAFADLPHYWPAGVGSGERSWILENVTAGSVRNGRWRVEARLPPPPAGGHAAAAGPEVTALSGTAEATGVTVHWLRPIPPAERASATARFGLEAVVLQLHGGRQAGLELREGSSIRFAFPPGDAPPTAEMQLQIQGPAADTLALVRHPRLKLFERRPMPIREASGRVDARLSLNFPLLDDLPVEELRVRSTAKITQLRVPNLLLGQTLERGTLDLTVDNDGMRVTGSGQVMEIPARLGVELDFRPGPASQVVMKESVTARADASQIARLLDVPLEDVAAGPMVVEVRTERRRSGDGRVALRADLKDSALRIEPLAWAKPPGHPSNLEASLRLQGDELQSVESFTLSAPELRLRGSAGFGRQAKLERLTINEAAIAASRFDAEVRPPARGGEPWRLLMRGAVLDLRAVMAKDSPRDAAQPQAASDPPGASFAIDARFDSALLGDARQLTALTGELHVDGRGVVRAADIGGRAGERGDFRLDITPAEGGRNLRLTAEDGGALLSAFDVVQTVRGGKLSVTGRYGSNLPGAPLAGSAEMTEFSVRDAPAFAKLLQAMTLYGLLEAARGPGLGFARLVAPFTLSRDALVLEDARAFSASLGLTAKGRLDRRRRRLEMEGTIVPAYIFNSLLGYIPLIGRLFSPEQGGGVFAATWRMQGPLDDPQVSVNPLAALTPGFLRGLFGIGDQQQQPPQQQGQR